MTAEDRQREYRRISRRDSSLLGKVHFLRALITALSLLVPLIVLFSLVGVPLWLVPILALPAAGAALLIIEGVIRFIAVAAGRRSWTSVREQVSGDLERVKYYKRKGEFEEAFLLLESVLLQDPDNPEALALKAEILWEGLKDAAGAKRQLTKLKTITPNHDPLHRWAKEYYDEIVKLEETDSGPAEV